jgi:hypothetical protein
MCQGEGTLRDSFQRRPLWGPREKSQYPRPRRERTFICLFKMWMSGFCDLLQEKLSSLFMLWFASLLLLCGGGGGDYDDDGNLFLAQMLVFCRKIWYPRFIVCSVMAIFTGDSCLSFCQSTRGFHDLPKIKPSYPFMLQWIFIFVASMVMMMFSVAGVLKSCHRKWWPKFTHCSTIASRHLKDEYACGVL